MKYPNTYARYLIILLAIYSVISVSPGVAKEPKTSTLISFMKLGAGGKCGSTGYAVCLGFMNGHECENHFDGIFDSCLTSAGSPEFLNKSDSELLSQCFQTKFSDSPFLSNKERCELGNAVRGKRISGTCAACHGRDGNSTIGSNPRLAGLDQSYLVKVLQDYKSGARKNPIMNGFSARMSAQDIRDLAAYYSIQKAK